MDPTCPPTSCLLHKPTLQNKKCLVNPRNTTCSSGTKLDSLKKIPSQGYSSLNSRFSNSMPENRPLEKEIRIGNHPFSGATLVSGRVHLAKTKSQEFCLGKCVWHSCLLSIFQLQHLRPGFDRLVRKKHTGHTHH